MSKVKLQDKPIIIGTPIEIEKAVNDIRVALSALTWIDRPFFIAQRFYRLQDGQTFYYPETYAPEVTVGTKQNNYSNYARLTPDIDFNGMFFFMVGTGDNDYFPSEQNYIEYPVSIIFSVNLDKIDKTKFANGLFTQDLIRDARRILTTKQIPLGLDYSIVNETRDIVEVYREFSLKDIQTYNRAPLQCFRFDLTVRIQEDCD